MLHKCDVRLCVNPSHLFIGSQLDNIRDMQAKGRAMWQVPPGQSKHLRGEQHKMAKLTEALVQEIRERRSNGETAIELAAAFGVSEGTVQRIVSRIIWRSVA